MTIQNYLIIENSVVNNIILWDGDINTWQPPTGSIQLAQETTPAMVWVLNAEKTDYVLTQVMGVGDIGFTWDGSVCMTNQPKPEPKQTTTGTQTI